MRPPTITSTHHPVVRAAGQKHGAKRTKKRPTPRSHGQRDARASAPRPAIEPGDAGDAVELELDEAFVEILSGTGDAAMEHRATSAPDDGCGFEITDDPADFAPPPPPVTPAQRPVAPRASAPEPR